MEEWERQRIEDDKQAEEDDPDKPVLEDMMNEAKTKLAAATREADKKTLTSAVGAWTSAGRSYTTALNKITLNIKKLEAAKLAATNQPTALKADLANTKSNAQLICTKGF